MIASVGSRPDPNVDEPSRSAADRSWFMLSIALAVGAHVAVALALPGPAREVPPPRSMTTEVIDIEPPAPPPSEQQPTAPEPRPPAHRPASRPPRVASRSRRRPAGRAGDAMSSSAREERPLDFTTGSAPFYSGSPTTGDGPRSATAGPGGREAPPAGGRPVGAGPDRSRRASVAGGLDWSCPFPPEADLAGVDDGVATLKIAVDSGGRVRRIAVLSDPGLGFGRAAKRCALARSYRPAMDRVGRSIPGTLVVRVRFVR